LAFGGKATRQSVKSEMSTTNKPLQLLLVEDSPSDAALHEANILAQGTTGDFFVTVTGSLQKALGHLKNNHVDAMLLDLNLPDSTGLSTIQQARQISPDTPIIVLTGLDDEKIGMEAVHAGVQDYLVKGQADGRTIIRAVRYAIQRKKIETELRESSEQLEFANKELEAFSYSVAHDLRNPLNSMAVLLSLFSDESKNRMDETEREALRRIDQAVARMGSIISDLLTLSKISRQEVQRKPVDLNAIVREIFNDLKTAEPLREVTLEIKSECTAEADSGLTVILLENIIRNAWKFTSKRKDARIEFGTVEGDRPPVYYLRDNGTGFDMAKAKQLFKPFKRLHSDKEFPGTGIGLAIVERIVNKHGGKVWAESEVRKGATFYFSLSIDKGRLPGKSNAILRKPCAAVMFDENLVERNLPTNFK
jgi:signal transduction histidine kinase